MSDILNEWKPSVATIDLIKLNGIDDKHIDSTIKYLKSETELNDINDVEGYDNWNSFFIVFCIKARKNVNAN